MSASRSLIACLLAAAPLTPLLGQHEMVVSPDRIDDVAAIRADTDSFPVVDNFAWRAFIALNWPSLIDADHRGQPDRTRTLGDPGVRVWETFKARYELFQVSADGKPAPPEPWASYQAANPCGPDVGAAKTLAAFEPFMEFNQFGKGTAANPLVAQNRTYTRYETRFNEPHFSALTLIGWSQGHKLPDEDHPARIPAGAIAVKAAWRVLTAADTPAVRARYYVAENTAVVDIVKTMEAKRVVCTQADVALVGFHMVIRTPHRPQGLWSTFEHVDNVPPAGTGDAREPDARDAGAPYSYFDASKPGLGLWPRFRSRGTLPVSLDRPPVLDPEPMQVVRRLPIHQSTMAVNRVYWGLPGIKGTVWQHYMLVATQWPTLTHRVDPYNDGIFFPAERKENLVNTTIETYFQDPPSSCMSCHQVFNARGHDFVGMLGSFR